MDNQTASSRRSALQRIPQQSENRDVQAQSCPRTWSSSTASVLSATTYTQPILYLSRHCRFIEAPARCRSIHFVLLRHASRLLPLCKTCSRALPRRAAVLACACAAAHPRSMRVVRCAFTLPMLPLHLSALLPRSRCVPALRGNVAVQVGSRAVIEAARYAELDAKWDFHTFSAFLHCLLLLCRGFPSSLATPSHVTHYCTPQRRGSRPKLPWVGRWVHKSPRLTGLGDASVPVSALAPIRPQRRRWTTGGGEAKARRRLVAQEVAAMPLRPDQEARQTCRSSA